MIWPGPGLGARVAAPVRLMVGAALLLLLAPVVGAAQTRAAPLRGPLLVFNAGSLAKPMGELLRAFAARHPGVEPRQENAGSVESARKLTELDRIPDLLAVADADVIEQLLIPRHATWSAAFARNAMVLAYTDSSRFAREITPLNWHWILRRPGVRTGRSDPALDPNGYRTLMVLQLTERATGERGLAAAVERAMPKRYMRPKEADLVALLQAGELDYIWSYRSIAMTNGLRAVDLPAEVDLADPARAALYGTATVTLPATPRRGPVTFRGAPIVYALTIPTQAPSPALAAAFVRFVLGPEGQRVLVANGFTLLERPLVRGAAAAAALP